MGGLVSEGSLKRLGGTDVQFEIGDGSRTINVSYRGLLPDLFREGQGVVAEGKLDPAGHFIADTVLAKHDEKYMPREVADSLKKQGMWRGDEARGRNRSTQIARKASAVIIELGHFALILALACRHACNAARSHGASGRATTAREPSRRPPRWRNAACSPFHLAR